MKCSDCGHTKFKPDSGYYYCSRCGKQGEQQLEYEQNFDLNELLNRTKIKTAKKETENRLTSWEEYNYILYGLVNELLELGAKDALKLTVMQLWSAYLRSNEVAFFSRKEPKLPKLGAAFRTQDAEILYNLKRAKRRKKKKAVDCDSDGQSSATYSRRTFRRTQTNLAVTELAALQSQRDSNASMSILSQSIHSSEASSAASRTSTQMLRLEFSRASRRLLKKVMPKKHLKRHEGDGLLTCHKFQRRTINRTYTPELVGRGMLYEILYLALNQIEDDIQMGDLIRFVREGHLTFFNVLKFFPENIQQNQKYKHSFHKSSSVAPSHKYVRYGVEQMLKLVRVDLKVPDLVKLARRYVDELALPSEVHTIVDTLQMVCPPEMTVQESATFKVPNYEGRAVALILFSLKLLFGLDDQRERKMSEAALHVNEKLNEFNSDRKKLFVWSEYVKFIEMRNVILAQCHYATGNQVDPEATDNGHLFADFLNQIETDAEILARKQTQATMVNYDEIFQKAKELHQLDLNKRALRFEPSLTPKRSYLNQLLTKPHLAKNIYIPEFMHEDSASLDMTPYLDPSDLRKYFKTVGVSLKVERLPCSEQFGFNRVFMKLFPETGHPYTTGYQMYSYEHDISKEDWSAENQLRQQMKQCKLDEERDVQTTVIKNHLAYNQELHRKQKERKRAEQKASDEKKNMTLNGQDDTLDDDAASQISSILASVRKQFEPSIRVEESIPLFDCIYSDDDDEDEVAATDEQLELLVNSYEYWLCMGYQNDMAKRSFPSLLSSLPKSFVWMLKQCAQTVQCSEIDLYHELQIVENQYAYVLQSFGKMKNTVLYSKITNRSQVPGMTRLSNNLRRYW